jgi:hypothetical protein
MIRAAANVLSLSFALPHEATHWAVARLGTDDAQMAVEVTGGRAVAAWPPLDSRVLRAFAFLAPTVFGSLLAALWVVTDTPVDGWRLIFAVGLAAYTVPSPADVRGALGKQAAQQTNET